MLYDSPLLTPLRTLASDYPDHPVLPSGQYDITARQLLDDSLHLARQLEIEGLKPGSKVVLILPPGPDFLRLIHALMPLRVSVALIDPDMGPELFAAKVRQLNPSFLFIDTRLLFLQEHPLLRWAYLRWASKPVYVPHMKGVTVVSSGLHLPIRQRHRSVHQLLGGSRAPVLLHTADSGSEFLITYTSGTLQEPKGVVHTHHSLQVSIKHLGELLQIGENERLATHLPHFLLLGIANRLPVYLWSEKLSPQGRLHFLKEHRITTLFGPPSEYLPLVTYCEKHGSQLPDTLRHVLLGSAPVHASFIRRLKQVSPSHLRISCTYGMTEHLLVSTVKGSEKIAFNGKGDLVGKPVDGVEVRIADDGEILLRSNQLFRRYFHEPDRPEFHATGDLGDLDKTGNLILHGRKKEMLIRRNTNIYPALYESTIKKIPGVDEAVMVGIYDQILHDERVYLVIESTIPRTASWFYQELRSGPYRIDGEALPDEILFITIPRKGRQQKVDRQALTKQIEQCL
jgi:acyl-CoA synthetase (AMP-forming)/AMP-acid ligase II